MNWSFPAIIFSQKKYMHKRECMRYYFWKGSPSKKECRKFLEERNEIIINENGRFIETVTAEQLKNI